MLFVLFKNTKASIYVMEAFGYGMISVLSNFLNSQRSGSLAIHPFCQRCFEIIDPEKGPELVTYSTVYLDIRFLG